MRVLAAMSGGVDSAVAAARAVDAGYEVTGVHLALSSAPATAPPTASSAPATAVPAGSRGCCSLQDSRDARRAADQLGIPFYVWDLAEPFRAGVVADFLAEYTAGRTPNPCLRCNERIKFAAVLQRAASLGFDAVVTGHYARLTGQADRTPVLHRAADPGKDQSYVLATLTADQLCGALFPLGDTVKDEVRAEAARRGLAVARKPDSHDICFIPDGDTAGFLRRHLGSASGPIVEDGSGEVLGEHQGAHAFTVGQRRGLGLGRTPDGRPRYVLGIEPVTRTVRVGPYESLGVLRIDLGEVVWHTAPRPEIRGRAQFRAHGEALPATATTAATAATAASAAPAHAGPRQTGPDRVQISLGTAGYGVAPGQTLVLYSGDDRVLLAGRIVATSAGAGPAEAGASAEAGRTGRTAQPA